MIDVPVPDSADPALLGPPGDAPMADAVVLLLHYGRPADLALLDLLHAAGHRGAIAVLAVADEAGAVAERAVREFGDDPAVRRVCHAVVPVAPATAVAAARLGDDEHRRLRQWVASTPQPGEGGPDRPAVWPTSSPRRAPDRRRSRRVGHRGRAGDRGRAARPPRPARRPPGPAARARRRGGDPRRARGRARPAQRAGGAAGADRVAVPVSRADALRSRSVLAGLDALLQAAPPPTDDGHRLQYQLERVRAGAHELRELELLDVLRSGDLHLPDEQRYAAERLLGADGDDVPRPPRPRRRRHGRAGARRGGGGRSADGGRSRPTRWSRRGSATPPQVAGVDRASGWRPRSRTRCVPRVRDGPGWTVPGWTDWGERRWGRSDEARRLAVAGCSLLAAAALLAGGCGRSGAGQAAPAASAGTPSATAPSATASRPADDGAAMPRAPSPPPRARHHRLHLQPRAGPRGRADRGGRRRTAAGATEVRLDVDGLLPNRGYAAHAHVNACGPTGDVAGPHFQNQVDPAAAPGKPSTDPAYANPQNEIWLDLRTDGDGAGEVASGGAVHVHRPRPGVDRDPRGRDDRHGPGPGRLRRCPAGVHHGAVPVARSRAGKPRPHTGQRAGTQVVTSVPARCPGCERVRARTTWSPSTATC